jgi:hypothetical protein
MLTLLQQFGWETGYGELEAELQARQAEVPAPYRDLFLGWMAAERGQLAEGAGHQQRPALRQGRRGAGAALAAFNEPWQLLGLPQFQARIGIAPGDMYLGNLGTYDKLDFTTLGTRSTWRRGWSPRRGPASRASAGQPTSWWPTSSSSPRTALAD